MVLVIDVVRILSAYGANVWEHIVFIFPRELLQKGLPVLKCLYGSESENVGRAVINPSMVCARHHRQQHDVYISECVQTDSCTL